MINEQTIAVVGASYVGLFIATLLAQHNHVVLADVVPKKIEIVNKRIGPNSYVNCDVPNHSIVFGNLCVIRHKDNAIEDYINNKI